jgi:hypothetical protein
MGALVSRDDQPGADGSRARLVGVGLKGMVKSSDVRMRNFKKVATSWWASAHSYSTPLARNPTPVAWGWVGG